MGVLDSRNAPRAATLPRKGRAIAYGRRGIGIVEQHGHLLLKGEVGAKRRVGVAAETLLSS